jgi:Flp pilus assembly pilin Flp
VGYCCSIGKTAVLPHNPINEAVLDGMAGSGENRASRKKKEMLRSLVTPLSKMIRNERGENLVSYALLVGAIAIGAGAYLANFSETLKSALNSQAVKLENATGGSSSSGSPTASNPGSPSGGSPTSGSPTSPSGGAPTGGNGNNGNGNNGNGNNGNGNGNGNNGNGNNGNGNNGNGNNGNGNGNGNGGAGNGNGNGNK